MKPRRKLAPSKTHATTRRATLPAGERPGRTMEAMLRDVMELVCDDGRDHGVNASLAWAACAASLGYLTPDHIAEALTAYQRAEDEEDRARPITGGERTRASAEGARKVLMLAVEFYGLHLATMDDGARGDRAGASHATDAMEA